MKYGKINHVSIVVKDWNEASDRYGRLLGIKHWYEIVTDEGSFDMRYRGEKKNSKVRIFYGEKERPKSNLSKPRAIRIFTTAFMKNTAKRYIT